MGISDNELPPERRVIGAAPVSWGIAVVVATVGLSTAGYFILENQFKGQVAGLQQQVEALGTQMAWKDERIATLEKKIADDAAMVQQALDYYQQSLAAKVKELTGVLTTSPASVQIYGQDPSSPMLAQIKGAFAESKWNVTPTTGAWDQWLAKLSTAEQPASGIYLSLPENESGRTVKQAFEDAGIPYATWQSGDSTTPTVLIHSWASGGDFQKLMGPKP